MVSEYYSKRTQLPYIKALIGCTLVVCIGIGQHLRNAQPRDGRASQLRHPRGLSQDDSTNNRNNSVNADISGQQNLSTDSSSMTTASMQTTIAALSQLPATDWGKSSELGNFSTTSTAFIVTMASTSWLSFASSSQTPASSPPSSVSTSANAVKDSSESIWSENDSCSNIAWLENTTDKCDFARSVIECSSDGLFQYTEYFYCEFAKLQPLLFIIYVIWLFYLLIAMGVTADAFVCPSLAVLAKALRLSPNVAGVTLVAFGNGAPDIFSSIASISSVGSDINLGIGLIFGAGTFVTTIVAAIISITAPFRAMERPLVRDILFYMLTVVLVTVFLFDKKVAIYEAFLLIGIYVIYVTTVIIAQRIFAKQRAKKMLEHHIENQVIERRLSMVPQARPTALFKSIPERDEHICDQFASDNQLNSEQPAPYEQQPNHASKRVTVTAVPMTNAASSATLLNGCTNPTFTDDIVKSPSAVDLTTVAALPATSKRVTWGGVSNLFPLRSPIIRRSRPETKFVLYALTNKNSPAWTGWNPRQPRPNKSFKDALRFAENIIIGTALFADIDTIAVTKDMDEEFFASLPDVPTQCCDMIGVTTSQPQTADPAVVEDTGDFDEEQVKLFATAPTWQILLHGISPINPSTWTKMAIWSRIFAIVKLPVVLFLQIVLPVVDGEEYMRKWNRPLRALQCIITPAMASIAFKQYGYTIFIGGKLPLAVLLAIIGMPFCLAVICTSENNHQPPYHVAFACCAFIGGMALINACATEMVNLLETFGIYLRISQAIIGLTLLSWGGSVGDLVADLALARQGFSRMAISACFGGPLFNALIGLGVPLAITSLKQNGPLQVSMTPVVLVMQCFLLTSLLSSVIIVPLRRFKLDRKYGAYLIGLYLAFFIVVLTVEIEAGHGVLPASP